MKKKFAIIIISMLLLCIALPLFVNIVSYAKEINQYLKATEYQYEKDTSVFINELNKNFTPVYSIDTCKKSNSVWVINEKEYSVQNTEFNDLYDPTIKWQIDLSKLQYCSTYQNLDFYSSTGKCDNDILVCIENNKLILLTSDDVLSPYKYECKDFNITNGITENFDKIWNDHLSSEYNIRHLLIEDDKEFEYIELQPKEHSELLYSFSYVEYKGNYFSKLPFDETSNNYYDILERIKNGTEVVKRNRYN